MRNPIRRRRRPAAIAALGALLTATLALAGCFDEPVSETLSLDLLADGEIDVRVETAISRYHLDNGNPRLLRRLRQTQRFLLEGWDPWPARFDAARPDRETLRWEKDGGELLAVERTAHLSDPQVVERFFADSLACVYLVEPGRAELAFYPTSSARATGGERQLVERTLADWSRAFTAYVTAGDRLYRYLDRRPERAQVLFATIFLGAERGATAGRGEGANGPARAAAADEELDATEQSLVDELMARIQDVTAVLAVPEDDAFTLDEISRRVFDPFPARLEITVPADSLLAVEGFTDLGDGRFTAPGLSLWQAARTLQGRWLTPDPAFLWAEQQVSDAPKLDLDPILAAGWKAAPPPLPGEVVAALRAALEPAPVYRVAWRLAAGS